MNCPKHLKESENWSGIQIQFKLDTIRLTDCFPLVFGSPLQSVLLCIYFVVNCGVLGALVFALLVGMVCGKIWDPVPFLTGGACHFKVVS